MAIVIWLVPLWMVWRCRQERWTELVEAWGAAAAAPVAVWAAFNLAWVGHILPVSGTLKLHSMTVLARRYGGRLTPGYAHLVLRFVRHYLLRLAVFSDAQHWGAFPLTLLALAGAVLVAARHLLGPKTRRAPTGDRRARDVLLLGLVLVSTKAAADLALLPFWAESWYAAPAHLAAGVLIGLGAYQCIALAIRHFRMVGVALAGLAILAVLPFDGPRLVHASAERPVPSLWQDADVEAVAWITAHGPIGVYGSPDAGLIGYYLDPGRPVVNLDGLINDYRYASMLTHGLPALRRYQAEGVRYLVGRLGAPGTADVPGCAVELWRSSHEVVYGGGSSDSPGVTAVPIRVYDLAGCPPDGPATAS
jgi:hypothetical protein